MSKLHLTLEDYSKNVFINCPFDEKFIPILKTLLYTIKRLGFTPRIALESLDSGEVRLEKIKSLIEQSQYGIHDLSRSKSNEKGEYSRLNMPFELGIDLGCRYYHPEDKYKQKKILILEEERYSTQKALSDLSFADCKCHKGDSEELVYQLREWFIELGYKIHHSGSSIWEDYNIFLTELYETKKKQGFKERDINRTSIPEFLSFIEDYI